ncbi:MAG: outer membrane protein [Paraperlucidibaca sp.]|jgi:outer membrane protein|tara:strand:+ start:25669 stop:27030 length:1362 start_codon:yes stop_codon:yes gene_type:complete
MTISLMTIRKCVTLASVLFISPATYATNLLDIVHTAEVKNSRFAALRVERAIANQAPDIARASLLPQIVLTASTSTANLQQDPIKFAPGVPAVGGDTAYDSTEWGGRVVQPLFNWGAFQQYQVAQIQRSYEQALADAKAQDLYFNIADAYFNVLRAQDSLSIAKSRLASLAKRLEEAQAKYASGFVSQVDILEQESQRDAAASQVLTAEDQLNSQRETLSALVGEPTTELATLRTDIPVLLPTPNSVDAWGKLAIEQNPNLLASLLGIEQSKASKSALKAEYLPQINFFASYSDRNLKGSDSAAVALNSGTTDVVGVEARWEIFSGGATHARVKRAGLQTNLALQNHESDAKIIENQARALFQTAKTDAYRIKAKQRSLSSSELAYRAIEAGYSAGTHSIVDVMSSETKVNTARVELATARYDYVMNCFRLYQIIGLLNESAITRINGWLVAN